MIKWMIEITVSSSLMIMLLLLTRILLKGKMHPKWQYALWGLVLLRLAVPVTLTGISPVKMPAVSTQMIETAETRQVPLPEYFQPKSRRKNLRIKFPHSLPLTQCRKLYNCQ